MTAQPAPYPQRPYINDRSRPFVIALAATMIGFAIALVPPASLVMWVIPLVVALLFIITPVSALVFLLVLAPMRTLIATEADFPLPLDIGQLLVIAFIAAWALERVVTSRRLLELPWSPIGWPLLGFVTAGALTQVNAWSNAAWLSEWLKWIFVLALVVLVMDVAHNRRWEWVLFALMATGAAHAMIGLYIFVGGSGADHLLVAGRFFRAFGTFGQPNPFGGFMGLLAPLGLATTLGYIRILWMTWRAEHHLDRHSAIRVGFYTVCTSLMIAALIASWSRGAWLSFAGAVTILVLALPRTWWQSLLMGVGLVASAWVIWSAGLIPASVEERIASATQDLLTVSDVRAVDITTANFAIVERLAHWQAALGMAEAHPWVGVGLGNFEVAYERYRLINWPQALGHAHNYYLNILAEGGMIGLIAYATLWISLLWITFRAREHPDPLARSVSVGLLGTWCYLLIHSLTDNLYVNNMFLHLGVLFGLLAVIERERRQSYRLEYTL